MSKELVVVEGVGKQAANAGVVTVLETEYGPMKVTVVGDLSKQPALLTLHDVGLNHVSCFQRFFNLVDQEEKRESCLHLFAKVHIDVPGQEHDAPPLPDTVPYLDMDVLVGLVLQVCKHFNIKHFIGFGVGAGAYILTRFASQHPHTVRGLITCGTTARKNGWIEWASKLVAVTFGYFTGNQDWYEANFFDRWFSELTQTNNLALMAYHRRELERNEQNIWKFLQGYQRRPEITQQELDEIYCKQVMFVGDNTPHENEAVHVLSLNKKAEWVRLRHTGILITEEKPQELLKPIGFFLNALGMYPHISPEEFLD